MKPAEYRGSLTREQFLFFECRIVSRLILEGKSENEIYEIILRDNLFQFPTEKNIRSIASGCYRRLTFSENMQLIELIGEAPADIAKQACLYCLMLYNRVVWDMMEEVIAEKFRNHDLSFDKSSIMVFCSKLRTKDENVAEWSDSTIKKISSVLMKCLIEASYLNSSSSKELNPVYLYEEVKDCIVQNGDQEILPAFNCLD